MSGVLHRQLAAGVFYCGAKFADGARGTPRPDKVTCAICNKAHAAKQDKRKTSLRLLSDVRERLLAIRDRPRRTPKKGTPPR